jgi:glycosyltransferase involved in cell wall biosynthesis
VLRAALSLRLRADILFLFIGEGTKGAEIQIFVETHGLSNIRMLPYEPRENLRFSLAAGHASLVTLAQGLAGLSVPSKAYGILAAGRPILFVGDARSSVARIVRDNNCGVVVSSGDSERLAQTISDWASDPEKLSRLNVAARETFEKYFDRARAVNSYLETFSKCMESSHSLKETGLPTIEETSR